MLDSFSDEKIVELLEVHSLWGRRACREIIGRKGDFIPLLLGVLDEASRDTALFINEGNDCLIPAALLLGQFRVKEAYPRIVSLLSLHDDDIDSLWGVYLMEECLWILRDTFNGEAFLLPNLIINRAVSPWARSAAVLAWSLHYVDGFLTREEITGRFRRLMHDEYAGPPSEDDKTVLSHIAYAAQQHQLDELIDDVKAVYARGGIDDDFCGSLDEYLRDFELPLQEDDQHIDDAVAALERWDWFNAVPAEEDGDDDIGEYATEGGTKIGRNDPCPCGSGKKYKRCCLDK